MPSQRVTCNPSWVLVAHIGRNDDESKAAGGSCGGSYGDANA
jgi:hypothetical protein